MTDAQMELDLSSANALRSSAGTHIRDGSVAWIPLDGLSIEHLPTHAALCRALTRFGFDGDADSPRPSVAVFDWTRVTRPSAEGLALFAVLLQAFAELGPRVICCEPAEATVARILSESGARALMARVEIVPCDCTGMITVSSVGELALFNASSHTELDGFCEKLSGALKQRTAGKEIVASTMGLVAEILHNVLSHANARHAAASALLFARRRPPVLQIGVADDGVGIASHVLGQERHQWLAWLSDASVTETVLHEALSGRDSPSGGGFSRLLRRFLAGARSRVLVRSGTALIALQGNPAVGYRKTRLTYGAGTQIRAELPLV